MTYDCIVIGLGGHGSSGLAQLAKSGLNVLGIEKFEACHENGSSHGKSRIFRQAYYEDPKYVPLLRRSLELWKELNALEVLAHKPELLSLCGGLMIGPQESSVIQGTLRSIEEHCMEHQIFNSVELQSKYPMLHPNENEIGVFEADAGYLNPEACIAAYLRMAESYGAVLKFPETMLSYTEDTNSGDNQSSSEGGDASDGTNTIITVTTNKGVYKTRKLVLTVGAWAPELYGIVVKDTVPLRIERRVMFWFEPLDATISTTGGVDGPSSADSSVSGVIETATGETTSKNMPVYIWDTGDSTMGDFYGFPEQADSPGQIKIAFHIDNDPSYPLNAPFEINRTVLDSEIAHMRRILEAKIPSFNGRLLGTKTCILTLTSDGHFLVDFHPNFSHKSVILASPCSGHGFKFCSIMGEIITELVTTGESRHGISSFRIAARNQRQK